MRDPLLAALFGDFLLESRERLDHLEEILLEAAAAGLLGTGALEEVQRELHTLKGNAGLVGLATMQLEAHAMEDMVTELPPGAPRRWSSWRVWTACASCSGRPRRMRRERPPAAWPMRCRGEPGWRSRHSTLSSTGWRRW